MMSAPQRRLGVSLTFGLSSILGLAGCQESGPVAIPSGSASSGSAADVNAPAQAATAADSRFQGRSPQMAPRAH